MADKDYDWSSIAKNPRFVALCQRKNRFLFRWWLLGCLPYLLTLAGAGYVPQLLGIKILGRINIGYAFCVFNFFSTAVVAYYYAYKAGSDFDPKSREFVDELVNGEGQ